MTNAPGSTPPEKPTVGETASMVRSEEELRVDKMTLRAVAKAHIRKRVVTEDRTITVQIRREELVIEEEAYDAEPSVEAGNAPSQALELVLNEEAFDIVKRSVPVERVRITTEMVTEQREVSGDIRKERIEVQPEPT